jgi:hypothetical protein
MSSGDIELIVEPGDPPKVSWREVGSAHHEALVEALDLLVGPRDSNELAYLAVTSKPELPIRDRLAWRLQCAMPDRFVAREWPGDPPRQQRCDLAVLDRAGTPDALVEVKATASFGSVVEYQRHVETDLRKARALEPRAEVYALLISTHVEGTPVAPRGVVKYAAKLQRGAAKPGLAEHARDAIDGALASLGSVHHGCWPAGTAYGATVHVEYWLVSPS